MAGGRGAGGCSGSTGASSVLHTLNPFPMIAIVCNLGEVPAARQGSCLSACRPLEPRESRDALMCS